MSRFANTPALTKSRQEAVTQGGVAHNHEKYAFVTTLRMSGADRHVIGLIM
jgi:hypothetical protein